MTGNLPRIFCAIDTADADRAVSLCASLAAAGCGLKFGLEFFSAHGPDGVRRITAQSAAPFFLDLKFHDIPQTVARAVRTVTPLAPAYLNVHAGGGFAMMRAARDEAADAASRLGINKPALLAVTILTSLDDNEVTKIGFSPPVSDRVRQLALLAREAGMDGVVCSPHEIASLRRECGGDFILMVPGIRPANHERGSDDQKRTMTPEQAIAAGASHLVIGRPITGSDDPGATARALLHSL